MYFIQVHGSDFHIKGATVKCRVCGNDSGNQAYDVREMMFGSNEEFHYFQCATCDCLQIDALPTDCSTYYRGDYYSYRESSRSLRSYLESVRDQHALSGRGIVGRLLQSVFPNEALRSLRPLAISKETSILDVGCGAGALLQVLSGFGMKNLLGVDPYIEADIRCNNGVEILKKEIHEVDGPFDLIMLHHSFEHMWDPAEILNAATNLLKPGGTCLVRIPVVPSYAWERYGVNWIQLDAPRHFYLHSRKSMDLLARQAGLEVKQVVYDSTAFQFWGSEQYVRGIPLQDERSFFVHPLKSTFSFKQIFDFSRKAKELNRNELGDQAAFYLQKRNSGC